MRRALFALPLILAAACGSQGSPLAPSSTLQGVLTVTSSTQDLYTHVGSIYPLNVDSARIVFGESAGAITADVARADGGRHVEAQRVSMPAAWSHLASTIGVACDVWPARKVGHCQIGIADAYGTTEIQGEVRF
jgi:hypothetical protein